ncbi:lipoate--protein ligase family protein, partial [Candidatus Thorarchaeota archaeon]
MSWRLLEEDSTDVYWNLALEESIAKTNADRDDKIDTLRFWRTKDAVVMGRLQCLHKEANIAYCQKHNIDIARRFTGGGAVFHDLGNLNFAICVDHKKPYAFKTLRELYWNYIGFIAQGLRKIGIEARYDERGSCMRIGGSKITGTAGWVKHGVSFIHGTLLIDSDLDRLRISLRVPPDQPKYYRDKRRVRCTESKRDRVTSIACEMQDRPTDTAIKKAIIASIESLTDCKMERGTTTPKEIETAEVLYR